MLLLIGTKRRVFGHKPKFIDELLELEDESGDHLLEEVILWETRILVGEVLQSGGLKSKQQQL